MPFRVRNADLEVLASLLDYQVLTTSQLTVLHFARKKAALRRLGEMVEAGLVAQRDGGLGRQRGRAESVFSISVDGARLLQVKGLLPGHARPEEIVSEKIRALDHELLLGWFRIHLEHIPKVQPRLAVEFFSSHLAYSPRDMEGNALLRLRWATSEDSGKEKVLVPDAVFRITDQERDRSVLFFLEVDMDTEALASPQRLAGDVRQKIAGYQACFRSGVYKRFEQVWQSPFTGFRVLFLASSEQRASALCRLVLESKPSDFIWITSQERMLAEGLGATIWARGGNISKPAESILNWELACRTPLPSIQS